MNAVPGDPARIPRVPVECRQCGAVTELEGGRCAACGAAVDVGALARGDRRAAILRVIGEEWYWWVGEIAAVAVIAGVVAGALPM